MTSQLTIAIEGHLGVIGLNRPEAINALSRVMIAGITETLEHWRSDENIRAVLFEGVGPRGFCAGGDVRAARAMVLDGELEEAARYFAEEYAMNFLIATYGKPIAVLAHGVVMGGGIGIAGHARFRFAVGEAKYAMPEAAIGFFGDVGVNAILAAAPEHRALAFLLSGLTVGVGDALNLGLADCAILPDRADAVRASLVAASGADDVDSAIARAMVGETIVAGEAVLCDLADRLAGAFSLATAAEIAAAITAAGATAQRLSTALASRSPTSLEAILQSHRAARKNPDIAAVLAADLRLARFMAAGPDFAEGVRALLIDKDQNPVWRPPSFTGVAAEAIGAAIVAPDLTSFPHT